MPLIFEEHFFGSAGGVLRACSTSKGAHTRFAALVLAILVSGCSSGIPENLTSEHPYSGFIGARYRVVATNLYAYGVYESLNDKKLSYITLVPLDLSGPEFAFRRTVAPGQTITILSAWRRAVLLDSGVYYLVEVENADLPQDIPVRLEMFRGNEGRDGDLNPEIYKRLR